MRRWVWILALPWVVVVSSNPYDLNKPDGQNYYIFEAQYNDTWSDFHCHAQNDQQYTYCSQEMQDLVDALNYFHEQRTRPMNAPIGTTTPWVTR